MTGYAGGKVATVQGWTGYEARALRKALRQSVRGFAEHLGVGVGTVSKWERLQRGTSPRPWMQEVLDAALAQAPDAAQDRFHELAVADRSNDVTTNAPALESQAAADPPRQTGHDFVLVQVRVDGRDVLVPVDRRTLLGAGTTAVLGSVAEALPIARGRHTRIAPATQAQLDELLMHFREQWHLLVKTDNLLGPRHAIQGVLHQLQTIDDLLESVATDARRHVVQIAAQYAESASWLYEDSGNLTTAHYWSSRAMEWAHEADDSLMLSWTLFRRSQQAAAGRNAAQVVTLAQAAGRTHPELLPPMRAAIAQQEAQGYALEGSEVSAQHMFDKAHQWAATDTDGEARTGHGSFCTPSYIELQRAGCWLTLGWPQRAIDLYEETLPELPAVYVRDRGVALGRLASAYATVGQPERAACAATEALQTAQTVGSVRTLHQLHAVGQQLEAYRMVQPVAELLDELATTSAS